MSTVISHQLNPGACWAEVHQCVPLHEPRVSQTLKVKSSHFTLSGRQQQSQDQQLSYLSANDFHIRL